MLLCKKVNNSNNLNNLNHEKICKKYNRDAVRNNFC